MKSQIIDIHSTTALSQAARVIETGGVVAFPSDTSYGLAVDPTQPEALAHLYALKQRDESMPVSVIFPSLDPVSHWAQVSDEQQKVLKKYLPGAFTFLLKPTSHYPLDTPLIGVRIPDNRFTQALSTILDRPYTATSANLSGRPAAYSVGDLNTQFKHRSHRPNLIIDAGTLPPRAASTIVDLTTKKPVVIRQGSGVFAD